MARNELAAWMSKRRSLDLPVSAHRLEDETAIEDLAFLPPTIDNARECKMCYAVDSCMLYRKVRLTQGSELMIDR
jgi:DNA replication ATP-dependent helicase Dna2